MCFSSYEADFLEGMSRKGKGGCMRTMQMVEYWTKGKSFFCVWLNMVYTCNLNCRAVPHIGRKKEKQSTNAILVKNLGG